MVLSVIIVDFLLVMSILQNSFEFSDLTFSGVILQNSPGFWRKAAHDLMLRYHCATCIAKLITVLHYLMSSSQSVHIFTSTAALWFAMTGG